MAESYSSNKKKKVNPGGKGVERNEESFLSARDSPLALKSCKEKRKERGFLTPLTMQGEG